MQVTDSGVRWLRVYLVLAVVAAVLAWPVFNAGASFWLSTLAYATTVFWIASFAHLEVSPWPYNYIWAGVVSLLSFVAPLIGLLAMHVSSDRLVTAVLIVGALGSGTAIYMVTRR
jgi:hypothetical protein